MRIALTLQRQFRESLYNAIGCAFIFAILFFASATFAQQSFAEKLALAASNRPIHENKVLGPLTYVSEKAFRLTKARVLWINKDYLKELGFLNGTESTSEIESALLKEFAWGIPSTKDARDAFSAERKTVYADYYGGMGIGDSRGSGRAAEAGRFQIKGLGRTQLVTRSIRNDHSNGVVGMEESMREAIWSEVNKDAPYGSNRVIALISRGTRSEQPNGSYHSDVLIIRESPVRPAHFVRVIVPTFLIDVEEENARLLQNSKFLAAALPLAENKMEIGKQFQEYIKRIAAQYAYLFANRFYHGATSESNIEISGKLLDFGTQTAQPGYGKVRILEHQDPAGEVSEIFESVILNFLEQVKIYLPNSQSLKLPSSGLAEYLFKKEYTDRLRYEFLLLTGVSANLVEALIRKGEFETFADLLIDTATAGAKEVIGRNNVPEDLQRYDMNRLLMRLGNHLNDTQAQVAILTEEIPGLSNIFLRSKFLKYYQRWMNRALFEAQKNGQLDIDFLNSVSRNTRILNRKAQELYRWNIMSEQFRLISKFEKTNDPSLIQQSIDERIKLWRTSRINLSCEQLFGL